MALYLVEQGVSIWNNDGKSGEKRKALALNRACEYRMLSVVERIISKHSAELGTEHLDEALDHAHKTEDNDHVIRCLKILRVIIQYLNETDTV
ncbi:Uu.00g078590.m01.CDS01 [Anthostomella pinea]|uniref:Uu.00g078590.m01.CDS01 n=1 Tax=Anthostomella pinea TaxID=933095 RepID=A0AAI8VKQ6_9PEZI|nr:Uu.00g078590.m01.CDS01 [Anthostomella pinea]